MRAIFLKIILSAAGVFIIYFLVSFFVRSPISAEYWVPEMVVVKKYLIKEIKSPKIVFIGGSNVLYNIDAAMIEKELNISCFNFGLHAGMPLKWLLDFSIDSISQGDTVIIALEQAYYQGGAKWDTWRFRNAVAWKHEALDQLGLKDKLHALLDGGTIDLSLEILSTKFALLCSNPSSPEIKKRLIAFENPEKIIKIFNEGELSGTAFPFWQPIDRHGTVMQSDLSKYNGKFVDVTSPNTALRYFQWVGRGLKGGTSSWSFPALR
jgi:hypothetical protein